MKDFFIKLHSKFRQFMIGRYGADELYKALLVFYLVAIILTSIIGRFTQIGYYVSLLFSTSIIVFSFCRVFSKNINKRQKENINWLNMTYKVRKNWRLIKDKWTFRKTHVFKKCPSCKAVLRLPRKKGTHNICCPHCKKDFKVKVH